MICGSRMLFFREIVSEATTGLPSLRAVVESIVRDGKSYLFTFWTIVGEEGKKIGSVFLCIDCRQCEQKCEQGDG